MLNPLKKVMLSATFILFLFAAAISVFSSLISLWEVYAKQSSNNLFYIFLDTIYVASEIVILMALYEMIFLKKESN
jgi:hypothetical protein